MQDINRQIFISNCRNDYSILFILSSSNIWWCKCISFELKWIFMFLAELLPDISCHQMFIDLDKSNVVVN